MTPASEGPRHPPTTTVDFCGAINGGALLSL
ncbi:uncharacterized protein G2W53_017296 [Senna tora]|uniref:Uncharacterized protein n=1 Tax=Senna tora TaxID=362788 RepID=A0A834WKC7_9FABA|nr:uncharacterized protein G2W53_017296 [Senna tora]